MEFIIMNDPENLSSSRSGSRIRNIPALISIPFQLLTLLSLTIVFWSSIFSIVTLILGLWGFVLAMKKPYLKGKIISLCAIIVGGAAPSLFSIIINVH